MYQGLRVGQGKVENRIYHTYSRLISITVADATAAGVIVAAIVSAPHGLPCRVAGCFITAVCTRGVAHACGDTRVFVVRVANLITGESVVGAYNTRL